MCMTPSMPKITNPPQLQPAVSPYGSGANAGVMAAQQNKQRMGLAATILTPPGGPAGGATTSKTLLGG